ncbi:MAG: MFS transporter [Bacteroidales bacterium]|nr:MFS transporter [Bacteroidales bacterium]
MAKILTRTVIVLSFVSLFTDIASEMLYPVIPIYLASLNYTAMYIGFLEGFAEFVAGLSKGYFGIWSDKIQQRLPFVRIGYLLSAISKPLMILFSNAWWIFFTRLLDRLGKGIRTASRDAILSSEATHETKGKVFGFHRAMDTLGAAIGPLIALAFLYFYPGQYKWLFVFTIIPGIISVMLLFLLKEQKKQVSNSVKISFLSFFSYVKKSSVSYKLLITGFLLFALFNSSDMFLLLKLKEQQMNDHVIIALYIFYNLSYAIMSYPAGFIADKLGLNYVYMFGMVIFAVVYLAMAWGVSHIMLWIVFFMYGFYAAATEGIGKAWISNIVPKEEVASAIGTFHSLQSISAIIASAITGIIWTQLGASIAFTITAIFAIVSALFLLFVRSYIKA